MRQDSETSRILVTGIRFYLPNSDSECVDCNYMEEIANFFKFSIDTVMAAKELNFLSEPSDILKALLNSKEEGTSIGIKAIDFGTDPIITAVEDIIFEDGQTLIVIKHYDLSGYILPSYKINLLNISAVYPFASPFKNPILHNLEKEPPIV